MLNQPIYDNTQVGRQPLNETVTSRAITMNFDLNGNAIGQFNSVPFKVKEIRVIASAFEDGGLPTEGFGILWCDLFQSSPVCILGLSTSQLLTGTSNFYQTNGSIGTRMQFNPPRDIGGQINFRLTDTNFEKTSIDLPNDECTACIIFEFVRGE